MNQERPLIQNRLDPETPLSAGVPQQGYPPPDHMQPHSDPAPKPPSRSKWLILVLAVLALVVAAAAVWALFLRDSGTDDVSEATGGSDETPEVVVIDESEVGIVQNPSLSAAATADGIRVENDGNVTMHDITVTDGGEEVCVFETLSPGEGADCAGASSAAVVAGLGPQDQPVEICVG